MAAPLFKSCDDATRRLCRGHGVNPSFSGSSRCSPVRRLVGMGDGSDTGARLAELLAALSLGIDLGFGQPMEHVLRQCRIALRLCELAGAEDDTRAAVYYSALLVNVGCHTDAYEQAQWFGDDIALKALKYAEAGKLSEMARMLRLLGSGATPLHRLR